MMSLQVLKMFSDCIHSTLLVFFLSFCVRGAPQIAFRAESLPKKLGGYARFECTDWLRARVETECSQRTSAPGAGPGGGWEESLGPRAPQEGAVDTATGLDSLDALGSCPPAPPPAAPAEPLSAQGMSEAMAALDADMAEVLSLCSLSRGALPGTRGAGVGDARS